MDFLLNFAFGLLILVGSMLAFIGLIVLCWRFKRIAAIIIGLIVLEKVALKLMEPVILNNHQEVEKLVYDNGEYSIDWNMKCKKISIAIIYHYRICIDHIPQKDGRWIKVQFPAGYFTLIPRDYSDRILFDGKILGLLTHNGKIEYYGD